MLHFLYLFWTLLTQMLLWESAYSQTHAEPKVRRLREQKMIGQTQKTDPARRCLFLISQGLSLQILDCLQVINWTNVKQPYYYKLRWYVYLNCMIILVKHTNSVNELQKLCNKSGTSTMSMATWHIYNYMMSENALLCPSHCRRNWKELIRTSTDIEIVVQPNQTFV